MYDVYINPFLDPCKVSGPKITSHGLKTPLVHLNATTTHTHTQPPPNTYPTLLKIITNYTNTPKNTKTYFLPLTQISHPHSNFPLTLKFPPHTKKNTLKVKYTLIINIHPNASYPQNHSIPTLT